MSDTPNVGSIRLYDAVRPGLEAGIYRVTSSLEIHEVDSSGAPVLKNGQPSMPEAPPLQKACFEVMSARFVLDAGDFQGCHPPRQAAGAFDDRLPQIVLGRRTLPWERQIDNTDDMPWLALLVFQKTELLDNNGSPLFSGNISQLLPSLKNSLDLSDDPQITVVKPGDVRTLQTILPTRSEVGLLAHVRQVNLSDTALAGTDDDGWFAVVTSNRLPFAAENDVPVEYFACLVSLEGRNDLWQLQDGNPAPPLIVLFSWAFTSQSEKGTFEHLVTHLDAAPFGAPEKSTVPLINPDGTIPVPRTDHQGNSSMAVYRGPLLGLNSDAPDGKTINDISLSAAWELGRLLGAADGHFIREMLQWHRKSEAQARSAISVRNFIETLSPRVPFLSARKSQDFFQTNDLNQCVTEVIMAKPMLRANLQRINPALGNKEKSIGHAQTAGSLKRHENLPKVPFVKKQPAGALVLAERLKALLEPSAQQSIQQRSFIISQPATGVISGTDLMGLSDYINHALAQFYLLCNIPFRYLVPDARLLPKEAIRFFTLDEDWLNALAAGALEQDINSTRERARVRLVLPKAMKARTQQLRLVRSVARRIILKNAGENLDDGNTTPTTVSGFLLCSSLVSGWPGLQVRAWKKDVPRNVDPTDPRVQGLAVPILRLERLSPSVLLALFDGIPRLIWLEEPHHGVQFGCEMNSDRQWIVTPRSPLQNNTGAPIQVQFRPTRGVIDITKLAKDLLTKDSSAALGLQLLRPPVRQRFSASQPVSTPKSKRHQ